MACFFASPWTSWWWIIWSEAKAFDTAEMRPICLHTLSGSSSSGPSSGLPSRSSTRGKKLILRRSGSCLLSVASLFSSQSAHVSHSMSTSATDRHRLVHRSCKISVNSDASTRRTPSSLASTGEMSTE